MKVLLLGADKDNPLIPFLTSSGDDIEYITEKINYNEILKINPDFIISYNYRYIISKEIIDAYKNRIINMHISLLPWNRGGSPNLWSFWDNTPKGITIHYIDEGIDTGDIIVQKEIKFDSNETLKSTYNILQKEIQQLLFDNWRDIKLMKNKRIPQRHSGSFHCAKDFEKVWNKIVLNGGWDIEIKELMKLKSELDLDTTN